MNEEEEDEKQEKRNGTHKEEGSSNVRNAGIGIRSLKE